MKNRYFSYCEIDLKYILVYTLKMFLINISKAFNKSGVNYALVGGYAVAIHGAIRGTMDVDFILSWELSNFKKAEQALNKLGLVSRLPISAMDVYNFREEYINNRNLIEWNFYNPTRPSEKVDLIITHNLANVKTINIEYQNNKIVVISKKALIRMKKESGREQDLLDIEALKKLP